MQYSTGKRCVFYHRYNIVWSTKYPYKVLQGDIQLGVRAICRQVCREKGGHCPWRAVLRSRPHVCVGPAQAGVERSGAADERTRVPQGAT